ncbi:hypothetical protein [Breoghania sp.]|uniref:hypothetical protein n=1 Tax=Breoghania sp. TaxID=2065378 RepID=UPI002616F88B|nr:hypothetical protein [Breoghania sp.]MDJ0929582.1 hypothetical protein [Breoghania sp.]
MAAAALAFSGCAGEPDATLLGVVTVPPKGVPGGVQPGISQAKPAVVLAATASEPADGNSNKPDYVYDPDSPNKVVMRESSVTAYAPEGQGTGQGARLKTNDAVNRTEEELRQLAQRNSSDSGRGLWNAKIRDLLAKRDHHIDDAIKKIEEDDAE